MKKIIIGIAVVVFVSAAGVLIYIASGHYNIGTRNHDNSVVNWTLETGMKRSVQAHADGIGAPPLDDPAAIKMGFGHYSEMCVSCHGAPGIAPDEIAQGLWPKAPDLAKTVREWKPEELFWITKNGVKFTAMPAWGPSHSDKMIWAMVAFMEKLPTLSAADYKKLKEQARPGEDEEHK